MIRDSNIPAMIIGVEPIEKEQQCCTQMVNLKLYQVFLWISCKE